MGSRGGAGRFIGMPMDGRGGTGPAPGAAGGRGGAGKEGAAGCGGTGRNDSTTGGGAGGAIGGDSACVAAAGDAVTTVPSSTHTTALIIAARSPFALRTVAEVDGSAPIILRPWEDKPANGTGPGPGCVSSGGAAAGFGTVIASSIEKRAAPITLPSSVTSASNHCGGSSLVAGTSHSNSASVKRTVASALPEAMACRRQSAL